MARHLRGEQSESNSDSKEDGLDLRLVSKKTLQELGFVDGQFSVISAKDTVLSALVSNLTC